MSRAVEIKAMFAAIAAAGLTSRERLTLIGRIHEQKTFGRIGREHGTSAAAERRRLARATEKLAMAGVSLPPLPSAIPD